jgi:peptide/nickel transport system permease protein
MGAFLIRRLFQLLVVLFAVATVLFFLLRVSGDPVALLAGTNATPEVVAQIRHAMGFDQPLYVQYLQFIVGAATLHFGDSIVARQDAMSMVMQRLPYSLELVLAAFIVAIAVGVPIGVYAGVRRGSPGSVVALVIAFLGQSMPSFWLGILAILVFAVHFHWLPTFGSGDLKHLILPAVTLGAALVAQLVRLTRSGMLEVLSQDYMRTAQAKGLPGGVAIRRHAIKNALIPVVTVIGTNLGVLLGGAVITETIFAWPGIGRQMIEAVSGRDYPVVQASVFVIAILVVAINLLVDIIYRLLDPRIKLA